MVFISILLLTVVGLMAANEWFATRFPQLKEMLEKMEPTQALIGVAALVLGIVWFFSTLGALFSIGFAPISVLLSLVGCSLLAKLGFLFAAPLLNEQLFKSNETLQGKVTQFQGIFEKHREKMGIVAVGMSIVLLIISLTRVGV